MVFLYNVLQTYFGTIFIDPQISLHQKAGTAMNREYRSTAEVLESVP